MTWLYEDQPVETLPEDCVGFVYMITNITNNRKYIGKKLAKFSRTTQKTVKLKNGNKKKKKIRSKVDSDWVLASAARLPLPVIRDPGIGHTLLTCASLNCLTV